MTNNKVGISVDHLFPTKHKIGNSGSSLVIPMVTIHESVEFFAISKSDRYQMLILNSSLLDLEELLIAKTAIRSRIVSTSF